jgi:hypothetical protein
MSSLLWLYHFVGLLGRLSSVRFAFASARLLISTLIFSIKVTASDF